MDGDQVDKLPYAHYLAVLLFGFHAAWTAYRIVAVFKENWLHSLTLLPLLALLVYLLCLATRLERVRPGRGWAGIKHLLPMLVVIGVGWIPRLSYGTFWYFAYLLDLGLLFVCVASEGLSNRLSPCGVVGGMIAVVCTLLLLGHSVIRYFAERYQLSDAEIKKQRLIIYALTVLSAISVLYL